MAPRSSISSIEIKGYRPFGKFRADVGRLEVLVGANGSGKSSLFEFLKVLRDGMEGELPPGLVPGSSGRRIYHNGQELIDWNIDVKINEALFFYGGAFTGRFGQEIDTEIISEGSFENFIDESLVPHIYLAMRNGKGFVQEKGSDAQSPIQFHRSDKLALGTISNSELATVVALNDHISNWRFYSSFNIAADKIRQPVVTQQEPVLAEDASNLSDVLLHLKNEHDDAFEELKKIMQLFVPGFKNLKVKSYGAPGQVMAFWVEDGVDGELSLADLSDGIFRLLCWTVLCVAPNPPTLVCIDEPDQGVHPRTLPILAALFQKASERTQIFLSTHNSYFLSQFDIEEIAVMRKETGEARFIKPKDSKALMAMLEDFGASEIEALHRSEELERLP